MSPHVDSASGHHLPSSCFVVNCVVRKHQPAPWPRCGNEQRKRKHRFQGNYWGRNATFKTPDKAAAGDRKIRAGRHCRDGFGGALLQVRWMDTPPSTTMAVPVTKLDASDARNSAAAAISAGVARRLRACRFSTKARAWGCWRGPWACRCRRAAGRWPAGRGAVFSRDDLGEADEAGLAGGIGTHAGQARRVAHEGGGEDQRAAAAPAGPVSGAWRPERRW